MSCDVSHAEIELLRLSVDNTAARSLVLLNAIEETIDSLALTSRHLQADLTLAKKVVQHLKICDRVTPIDPGEAVCESLEASQSTLNQLYELMLAKRVAAQNDSDVHHEDGLVEAFTETIADIADLHNAVDDLRWAVLEHDADLEPRTETG